MCTLISDAKQGQKEISFCLLKKITFLNHGFFGWQFFE